MARTEYRYYYSPGMLAVHDAMSFSVRFAHELLLSMAARYAAEYPENCAEFVRHAASTMRMRELEVRDMEREKTAAIIEILRAPAVSR